ncbi:PIR Superfamily Protein [Plasmodium ovale wallikeri]|uniref:PIR Superfamily Protein n=1 Tax=Plasmodium ovale wallikeri TaxID=864142 RepID=A0A1A9AIH6_PLAOA|nr:PIR Superfamily Protein [Plasmodium ovale wallikeri]
MSANPNLCTFENLAKEDNEFKNTALYKVYNKFLQTCDHNGDESYKYCGLDDQYANVNPSVRLFFEKVKSILNRIRYMQDEYFLDIKYEKGNVCTYFKYWFYDQIIDKEFKGNQITELFDILEKEKDLFSNANCDYHAMKLNEMKTIKTLYDYFAFYDTYKGKHEKIIHQISNSKYCKNFNNVKAFYSTFYDTCDDRSTMYCSEFKKFIKEYISFDDELSLSCNDEVIDAKVFEHEGLKSLVIRAPIWRDTLAGSGDDESYASMPEDISGNRIPTVVSSSLVGIFVILLISYKFTPLRSMLGRPFGLMKNILKNPNEGYDESELDKYEYEGNNSDYTEYNILYHSGDN